MIAASNEAVGATGLEIATYNLLKGRNLYSERKQLCIFLGFNVVKGLTLFAGFRLNV